MPPRETLLAACGGDTVCVFDPNAWEGVDPCVLQYCPSPGSQVNCVKWNHTNHVIVSAGDDRRVTLWKMNGGRMGALPFDGSEPDHLDDAIHTLCFSKGSRYLCTGGKGKVLRVWDTRKKLCIKTLKGHCDLITGVMYNQKEDQLASISVSGDLLFHNLQTGTRATEIKDPQRQALRALEYSPHRRSFLVTAGDEGTVNIWDTNSRGLKATWPKKHSAPATGVCFSPTDPKLVVSAGLDKRLVFYDIMNKTPVNTVVAEAPLSSLAMKDDSRVLAVGTNNGRILFYDIRKSTWISDSAIKAYPSQALVALSWQHSTPSLVAKGSMDTTATVSEEVALLGAKPEDVPLIPDPMPSGVEGRARSYTVPAGVGGLARSASVPSRRVDREQSSSAKGAGPSDGILGLTAAASSAMSASFGGGPGPPTTSSTMSSSTLPNHLRVNGAIGRLQTSRMSSLNGEMDVFSPLVDVEPLMKPYSKVYEGIGMGSLPSSIPEKVEEGAQNADNDDTTPGSARDEGPKLSSVEELRIDTRRRMERMQSNRQAGGTGGGRKSWGSRSGEPRASTPLHEESPGGATPPVSSTAESTPTPSGYDAVADRVIERSPSVTPPAMWGGDAPLVTPLAGNSRSSAGVSDVGAPYLTSRYLPPYHSYLPASGLASRLDATYFPLAGSSGASSAAGPMGSTWISGTEALAGSSLSLMAGTGSGVTSSRWQKPGATTAPNGPNLDIGIGRAGASSGAMSVIREALSSPSDGGGTEQSLEGEKVRDGGRSRKSDASNNNGASPSNDSRQSNDVGSALPDGHPVWTRGGYQPPSQQMLTAGTGTEVADVPQPSNFALQLVQNVVSETLGNLGRAMHEETQNLHLDVLRQFHMQQMETQSMYEAIMTNQSVLFDEIRALQREVQKLRHMY